MLVQKKMNVSGLLTHTTMMSRVYVRSEGQSWEIERFINNGKK